MSWKPGLNENLFCFEGFTTHFMKFIAEGLQIIKIDFVSSNPSEPALIFFDNRPQPVRCVCVQKCKLCLSFVKSGIWSGYSHIKPFRPKLETIKKYINMLIKLYKNYHLWWCEDKSSIMALKSNGWLGMQIVVNDLVCLKNHSPISHVLICIWNALDEGQPINKIYCEKTISYGAVKWSYVWGSSPRVNLILTRVVT